MNDDRANDRANDRPDDGSPDAHGSASDRDRDEINRRFEELIAGLRDDAPPDATPDAGRRARPTRPHPAIHHDLPTPPVRPRPTGPFSLDDALAAAEPDDDEVIELPRPVTGPARPGLALGFALLATAFLLAFMAMMGLRLSHELGVVGAGLGVVGLVLLLLNVRRGPRDDGLDHDPRDGSRL